MITKLKTIRNEAIASLNRNRDGKLTFSNSKRNVLYYFIPSLLSTILIIGGQYFTSDSITYFITGISIFAGLFFNLLLVVSEKMDKRKPLLSSAYEPTKNYAIRYRNLSESLISSISYSILLSIALIAAMFLTQFEMPSFLLKSFKLEFVFYINYGLMVLLNFIAYVLGIQFLFFLLHILVGIYDVLMHEMNQDPHQE